MNGQDSFAFNIIWDSIEFDYDVSFCCGVCRFNWIRRWGWFYTERLGWIHYFHLIFSWKIFGRFSTKKRQFFDTNPNPNLKSELQSLKPKLQSLKTLLLIMIGSPALFRQNRSPSDRSLKTLEISLKTKPHRSDSLINKKTQNFHICCCTQTKTVVGLLSACSPPFFSYSPILIFFGMTKMTWRTQYANKKVCEFYHVPVYSSSKILWKLHM